MLATLLKKIIGAPSVGLANEQTRSAWVIEVLSKLPPGCRILDAGAGEQIYRPHCAHLKYVAQDFGQYNGQGNTVGLQTGQWHQGGLDIICDIVSIPEPDASFDAILCTEVLEHLPDPVAALKEFSRLLKEGGRLILTAPFMSLTHFAPIHFATGFNRYFYEKHLHDFGFEITELTANGQFFEVLAQELRRTREIGGRYTNEKMSGLEKAAVQVVLKMLERYSKKDRGSSELLNFGFQVLAVKRSRH